MPATKDEIARMFMELASKYGYRRTSVEDVARVLRISKKTIYDFFAGKEDLLRYAVGLAAADQRARVESLLTATTALGRVEQVVRIALADARGFYASNVHEELLEETPLSAEVNARVFGPLVRDLVARGVAAGEFEVPDVDLTASFCMAVGMDAVRAIREDPARKPEDAALDAIRRMLAGKVECDER